MSGASDSQAYLGTGVINNTAETSSAGTNKRDQTQSSGSATGPGWTVRAAETAGHPGSAARTAAWG